MITAYRKAIALGAIMMCSVGGCSVRGMETSKAANTPVWTATAWKDWRPSTPPPPAPSYSEAEKQEARRLYLQSVARSLQLPTSMSSPPLERWVSPAEMGDAVSSCLRTDGWAVTPKWMGWSADVPDDQQPAFDRAVYECQAKYTLDPRFLSQSQGMVDVQWEYLNTFLVPCVRDRGHEPLTPPSLEVFRKNPGWTPYPSGLPAKEAHELDLACPRFAPPDSYFS